jgi:hypothetical protein
MIGDNSDGEVLGWVAADGGDRSRPPGFPLQNVYEEDMADGGKPKYREYEYSKNNFLCYSIGKPWTGSGCTGGTRKLDASTPW